MSSEEEDTNPKLQTKQSGEKQKKVEEETTDLNVNDESDDEEEQNIKDNDSAIKNQLTGISVSVENPQTKDGGALSKNYIIYEVVGNDQNGTFNVKRRYNEFNELRLKLVENWPGFFIPPIPEKKSTGNLDANFIKQRQHMLNHFMKRCARMPHIFYSDELQLFLKNPGSDLVKVIHGIKPLTPSQMYKRNQAIFPEYDKDMNEKTEKSVKKYFQTLESTIKFFQKFRQNAKNMEAIRISFKKLKTNYVKYAINDYKNKLKDNSAKQDIQDRYSHYSKVEKEDDLSEFLKNLKDLELDLNSFFSIKDDLKKIKVNIDRIKKKQEEANKNLSKVRSQESEEVKEGLFKKTTKTEKIVQLEAEIGEVDYQ